MEMETEFYVNTDMHVYVYVCVRDDSRDLEAGACFDRVFFLGMLEKQFVQFTSRCYLRISQLSSHKYIM